MDKLAKLEALGSLGGSASLGADGKAWTHQVPRAMHLYEGSSSDEDGAGFEMNRVVQKQSVGGGGKNGINRQAAGPSPYVDATSYDLEQYASYGLGQLAPEDEAFVPWQVVKKYPYAYIGTGNRQKVAEAYFDQGKISNHTWDLFYVYRLKSDLNLLPILLVPAKQLQDFLELINSDLNTSLAMPARGANGTFMVSFEDDGTPRPRYLGRTANKEAAETLRNNIPPTYYKPKNEPKSTVTPTPQALAAFKAKLELMNAAQKGKKNWSKEKSKRERLFSQQSWKASLKRTQRYLGLREASTRPKNTNRRGMTWEALDRLNLAVPLETSTVSFTPDILAPFPQEGRVVFVCVDIEAYERNNNLITEIGIATLDTDDLASVVPGEGCANWMKLIRARHFRINEHKHLNNTEFVSGCADRFEHGTSEFIGLKDAPRVVASCFKHPFSKPGDDTEPEEKRSIILVGHDLNQDINYLKKLGYDVYNLSNLLECVDTANMWKYMTRDNNPRKLAMILAELRLVGWNLHNAGNDAVYTLWAMIGISAKHLKEHSERDELEAMKQKRIKESVADAEKTATEREEGWSSEGSDGGGPVSPYIQSWLEGTQKVKPKPGLSVAGPEFNVKARKGQDVNAMMSQLGVDDKKATDQKPKSHEHNPRADNPFELPSMPVKVGEKPQRYDEWGQPIPGPPETPDPRWRLGRTPSPGIVGAFGKQKQRKGSDGASSSKFKGKGLALVNDKSSTSALLNLD
ncbi:Uncharacterized protein LSUB1_G000356 [Lachnellula subtilissima]|uniref:Gfd2/YDR514C-like C-terminal domain-containing protein n=1 Tax=Lachnellula subtilissima TaxID=602034 RepID=A0A8H8RY61_9HELO|nr:Uncharacterized protein LSUB1_G000356 [Lachnellula subtilissima]